MNFMDITWPFNCRNSTEFSLLEIIECLEDFALSIHNKWAHPRNGFFDWFATENKNIHLRHS